MDSSGKGLTSEDWEQIEAFIANIPVEPERRDSAIILLAALVVGANADKVAKATGFNRDNVVRPRAKRLRDSSIWDKGTTYCEWFQEDPDKARTAFAMDLLVAEGEAIRVSHETDGTVKYHQDATQKNGATA